MNVSNYLSFVPTIESWIAGSNLDAIVCGMGPSAWLLRYCNRKLFAHCRMFGVHDGCSIMPMDDLVLMDAPVAMLHPVTHRHSSIIDARPKRLWIMDWHYKEWMKLLSPAVQPVATSVPWLVWGHHDVQIRPGESKPRLAGRKLRLGDDPPHTALISPTGTTTLAWNLGCRRIGVIGVDLQPDQHHMFQQHKRIDKFFCIVAGQAHEQGGLIRNLSPITTCKAFAEWKPSISGSDQIFGNETLELSASSNTASASTQPAP